MRRIVIVGDGGWGTAVAIHLARKGLEVGLWSHDAAYAEHLRDQPHEPAVPAGYEIPRAVEISADLRALLPRADAVVSAIPTEFLRDVWTRHGALLPPSIPVVSLTKGVEQGTMRRPSEILHELVPDRPVVVMSGPNIAWEVAKGFPAAIVAAGDDAGAVHAVRTAFSNGKVRVYGNRDAIGVELGGALKNVIALAAGLCDGLGLGHNAKAALLTRGIVEIARLGAALGGERRTFFGLSGIGDLMTTCYSPTSRNRTVGERIGRGERPEDVVASMAQVAEGVKTAAPVRELGHRLGVPLPIVEEVDRVLREGKEPRDVVEALMLRGLKDEAEDLL